MIRSAVLLACALAAAPAAALDLALPATARPTVERNTDPDTYAAPVGVFAEGRVPRIAVEGAVRRAAWRISQPGVTPLQLMRPLRRQLREAGLEIVLDCAAAACGGFDFRFAVETLPGPGMYVNIRAFHFVTALRLDAQDAPVEAITVLTSASATAAYVQVVQAGALDAGTLEVATTATPPLSPAPPDGGADLGARLLAEGHAVLRDLDFGTGSSDLGEGTFDALDRLAAFLADRPGMRIALVGHTDTVGGLEGNIALSRRRAQSVRQRLIERYGVDPARLAAEGMGYLAPVASNLEEAGREANRRVEAVLLGEE